MAHHNGLCALRCTRIGTNRNALCLLTDTYEFAGITTDGDAEVALGVVRRILTDADCALTLEVRTTARADGDGVGLLTRCGGVRTDGDG